MSKKKDLYLKFGEWLIENNVQYQDNKFDGNVYSLNTQGWQHNLTMKELYEIFVYQLSRKECPNKQICQCHTSSPDGFCLANIKYKNFLE